MNVSASHESLANGCNASLNVSSTNDNNVYDYLLSTIYALIAVFIIVTNTCVLVGLSKTKRIFSRYDRLFMFLSSTDLCFGVIVMPYKVYLVYRRGQFTCVEVAVKAVFSVLATTMSGMTTCLIATDRYLYITKKTFHETYMTSKCIILILIFEVTISITWSFAFVYIEAKKNPFPRAILLLSFATYGFVLLMEVIIVNTYLLKHIRKSAITMVKSHGNQPATANKNKRRSNKTIFHISIALVIGYLPSFICFILASLTILMNKTDKSSSIQRFVPLIMLSSDTNAGINAAIFIWRSNTLKRFLKRRIFMMKTDETFATDDIILKRRQAVNISKSTTMGGVDNKFYSAS